MDVVKEKVAVVANLDYDVCGNDDNSSFRSKWCRITTKSIPLTEFDPPSNSPADYFPNDGDAKAYK